MGRGSAAIWAERRSESESLILRARVQCRRNVEMSPCAQSSNDTPFGGGQDQRHTASLPDAG